MSEEDMENSKNKSDQEPFVLWFTGLSGAGKSTLAEKAYEYYKNKGCRVEQLDGDKVRAIFPGTGFSKEERDQHVKKVGFLASLLEKHGVIVISSFISPYREARSFVRNMCGNFIEVYVKASVEACEKRDMKGLYKKARSGEIKNFTGVNDPYEVPENPEIVIETDQSSVEESFSFFKSQMESRI